MPAFKNLTGVNLVPSRPGPANPQGFAQTYIRNNAFTYPNLRIVGVTRDSGGVALPAATVRLFRTIDNVFILTTTSDGSGNYTFDGVQQGFTYYVVAYLAGAPDTAGTTLNTLVGVQP